MITGAAGQIAYSLLYSVTKGDVFGKDQVIIWSPLVKVSLATKKSSRAGQDNFNGQQDSWTDIARREYAFLTIKYFIVARQVLDILLLTKL